MYYVYMFTIRQTLQRFKAQLPHVRLSVVAGILIVVVGIISFSLGWIARGGYQKPSIQVSETRLPVTASVAGDRSEVFVASKNSDKYHYRWCAGAERIAADNKIYFADKEEAREAGYKPAGNCPGLEEGN